MWIFVDVNIFFDVQRRRGNWNVSYSVLKSVVDGKNQGFISALTPAIIYFLRREVTTEDKAREDTLDVIAGFNIVDLTDSLIHTAFEEERLWLDCHVSVLVKEKDVYPKIVGLCRSSRWVAASETLY